MSQLTAPADVPRTGPGQILPFAAARYPDKTALIVGDDRFTYGQLNELSNAFANALVDRGICEGDVVSLYGQNSAEWLIAYHGALKAAAVVNPVNVMLTGPELSYVLNDCGAKAIIAGGEQVAIASAVVDDTPTVELLCHYGDSGFAPLHQRSIAWETMLVSASTAPTPSHPNDSPSGLCSIAYTSGTTGHPKGAMQTQQSVLLNCAWTAAMHGRGSEDIVVTALPAAHVYGNVAINSTFLAGGTVVLMRRFDSTTALRLIESENATMFEGVPAMYSTMVADSVVESVNLTSLRKCTIGGQTFSQALADRWRQRAPVPLLELWGMTEISGLGTTNALYAPPAPGSIGIALPGFDVRVAPLDGSSGTVPAGSPGELVLRGPLVMLGYYGRPEATDEVFTADGWLRTGDVAYADETGHYFIVDRLKDMIVTAGYNVYPAEIERVICSHPGVTLAAVGRRPDEVKGEVAIAYVIASPDSDIDAESLMEHCKKHLAAYKRPRDVVFVDSLPTTSSGKLMRRKLAELDTSIQSTPKA